MNKDSNPKKQASSPKGLGGYKSKRGR